MPNFLNPIQMDVEELSDEQLEILISQCVTDEYEAAARYRQIAEKCKNPKIKELLLSIADEEYVHVGEFQKALSEKTNSAIAKGVTEAEGILTSTDEEETPEDEEEGKTEEEENDEEEKKTKEKDSPKKKIKILRM